MTTINGHGHHHHHDPSRHDARIHSFCLSFDEPLPWDGISTWLEVLTMTRGESVLRIKGILNLEGQDLPIAIHGVQHLFHPPARLAAWPRRADGTEDRTSRLVFILRDLDRAVVEKGLAAFAESARQQREVACRRGALTACGARRCNPQRNGRRAPHAIDHAGGAAAPHARRRHRAADRPGHALRRLRADRRRAGRAGPGRAHRQRPAADVRRRQVPDGRCGPGCGAAAHGRLGRGPRQPLVDRASRGRRHGAAGGAVRPAGGAWRAAAGGQASSSGSFPSGATRRPAAARSAR